MSSFQIRPYLATDHAACRACVVELQDSERAIDSRLRLGETIADVYFEQMHARCRECSGEIFVAVSDGNVVGLAMVLTRVPFEQLDQPPGEYALVAELIVREAYRQQGVGAQLLQTAEDYARQSGAAELRISVLSGKAAARRLYVREGFLPYVETLSKPLVSQRVC